MLVKFKNTCEKHHSYDILEVYHVYSKVEYNKFTIVFESLLYDIYMSCEYDEMGCDYVYDEIMRQFENREIIVDLDLEDLEDMNWNITVKKKNNTINNEKQAYIPPKLNTDWSKAKTVCSSEDLLEYVKSLYEKNNI